MNLEQQALKEKIKGMTEEEHLDVVRLLPDEMLWEELFRRNSAMLKRINKIEDILGANMDDVQTISIKAWEDIKKKYYNVKDKFVSISKMFGSN